jgi:hypothetical protein
MPDGHFAVIVAAASAVLWLGQGLLRFCLGQLTAVDHRQKTPRWCVWFKTF